MKKNLFIIFAFTFFAETPAFCQIENDVLGNAVAKLKKDIGNHINEKVYLHFDHPYACYAAGDVIYFKAYVTMGELHEPSTISGILHAELIDKNNTILQSNLLQLVNGTAIGDFTLPDTLQKGSYRVRAYTSWMRGEKGPVYFDQYISVSSVRNTDRVAEAVTPGSRPAIQFFPEGGNLVTDVPSKVAFKAIGTDGLGINVSGIIIDDENKEVARITSAHLGMGEFDFIPEEGKYYKAKLTFADGSKNTVELPTIERKGLTLSVSNNNPDKISIEIRANRAYYKENLDKELNLIIYGGGIMRTVKTKLDNEILGLDLPANTFRTGILQVTVLSATGEPLNERLAFIRNNDLLNLNIATGKPLFAKHENVPLSLTVKNKDGNPVTGSFSVSVIDESKILVDENSGNSILPYLLLSSELKGYIEKPNYYFANNTPEIRRDLDVLMLTQGYRRFVWKQLLNDSTAAKPAFLPEKHIDIAGIIKTKAGIPVTNSDIILIEKTGGLTLVQKTDSLGRFRFENINFFSGTAFILKTSQAGKSAGAVTLDAPLAGPAILPGNLVESRYNASADLLVNPQNNQAPEVFAANDQKTKVLLHSDPVTSLKKDNNYRSAKLGGAGGADQVITASQILSGTSLSDGLNGVARGIDFSQGLPYLKNSQKIGAGGNSPMLVIADGAVISNIDNISPLDVETVEILKGPNASIYGSRGADGVLIINTKQTGPQKSVNTEMSPGIFSVTPVGFYKAREFYSPQLNPGQAANNLPYQHTTVFWKPDFNTDVNGNASVNFLNGEVAGTYRVEIEGFDANGNLGRAVYRYKVE
jgi:TonB-dependent SusC/RagA subfamily outer membrane receptor